MTETERMLMQSLKRMEENCNARLTAFSTRLDAQEDKQMLIQTELRTLNRGTSFTLHFIRKHKHQLADLVGDLEKRRIERERQSPPRMR